MQRDPPVQQDRPADLKEIQVQQDLPALPEPQVLQDKVSQDLPVIQEAKEITVLQDQREQQVPLVLLARLVQELQDLSDQPVQRDQSV